MLRLRGSGYRRKTLHIRQHTLYSNTCKMAEKRQHGRHLRALINSSAGYSILFSFYSKIQGEPCTAVCLCKIIDSGQLFSINFISVIHAVRVQKVCHVMSSVIHRNRIFYTIHSWQFGSTTFVLFRKQRENNEALNSE